MTGSQNVDVGGVRLAIAEDGEGPPIILHPGLGYASWCWQQIASLLSDRYRTISVDPRGAGQSDKPVGPYSIGQLADDVASVLHGLGIEDAHVVGHSMGGYVAQVLAVRHPIVVRSLILVSTSPGGPGSRRVPQETLEAWREAAGLEASEFARMTFPYSFRSGWPALHVAEYEGYLEERLRWPTPPARWQDQFEACEAFLELGVDGSRVDQRTLIIHGGADRVIPASNAALLAKGIPNSDLVLLPRAGHNVMLEEPSTVATHISSFLRTVERLGRGE